MIFSARSGRATASSVTISIAVAPAAHNEDSLPRRQDSQGGPEFAGLTETREVVRELAHAGYWIEHAPLPTA